MGTVLALAGAILASIACSLQVRPECLPHPRGSSSMVRPPPTGSPSQPARYGSSPRMLIQRWDVGGRRGSRDPSQTPSNGSVGQFVQFTGVDECKFVGGGNGTLILRIAKASGSKTQVHSTFIEELRKPAYRLRSSPPAGTLTKCSTRPA